MNYNQLINKLYNETTCNNHGDIDNGCCISDRISFSLKTKSYSSALRMTKSVSQRLEDYWLGIRLQNMNVPAMHLVKSNNLSLLKV